MKKMLLLSALLVGNFSLACIGGHQATLKSGDKVVATLDKQAKKLTLTADSSLTYVGDCQVDNMDADLEAKEIDLSAYIDNGGDVCLGISSNDVESRYKFTHSELTSIARGFGCGGEFSPIKE